MLTREIMGCLALAILWVNTLLIVGAGAKDILALEERRARLKRRMTGEATPGFGLIKGRIAEGRGPGGALAKHRVEQVGRSAREPEEMQKIIFADRKAVSEVLGGSIELAGEGEAVITPAPESAAGCEVWVSEGALREAAACPSDEHFDAALADARKARGFSRAVEVFLKPGQEVWVAGEISRRGSEATLFVAPSRSFGLLVSALDPTKLLAKKITLSIAALTGMLAVAAGVTALALTPPYFGLISAIGAALCLGLFLGVQPAGTALRDAVLLPHRAFVRGVWTARSEARQTPPRTPETGRETRERPAEGECRLRIQAPPAGSDGPLRRRTR